eukprot:CAMPEP_0179234516 /NCGR_PEP_ID=MMETSP0797-20121207/12933_1 /TAXON_ID=47934 /ORGANISM="Dinophysis acuminata, Strain DAEP01" /LENGTH=332 /DNA_ID=CAMNT_0020941705 /DNA_START=162 /DNA_END=1157 /DNA_ORIENTATION=-
MTSSMSETHRIAPAYPKASAYVALLEMFRLPIVASWIGFTVWGFFVLRGFISSLERDVEPVEGAAPVVQSGSGVPFVSEKVVALSALIIAAALLSLVVALGNARLLLCTAVSLLVCMSTSILAMYTGHISAVTSVMMVAALSVTYTLYLLGRFRMALLDGSRVTSVVEGVIVMVGASGAVVLTSGVTLLVTEVMMLVFKVPKDTYFRFFASASVTISLAIATSASFMPLMLLLLPGFFGSVRGCGCGRGAAAPPRISAEDACAAAPREPATRCAWARRRVSDVLLLLVAVAAPVCFLSLSMLEARPQDDGDVGPAGAARCGMGGTMTIAVAA